MNKHQKIGGAVLTFGLVLLVGISFYIVVLPNIIKPTVELKLGDGVFKAYTALNEKDRIQGLSGVTTMQPDNALIMAYKTEDRWKIWMKDMKIPIDIVWLDKNKRVIYIVKNASPENSILKTFEPKKDAKFVIEFPAGALNTNSIDIDQVASFKISESDIK